MAKKNNNIVFSNNDFDIPKSALKNNSGIKLAYLGTYVGPKIYETIKEITEKTNKKYSEVVKDSLESYANNYLLSSKKISKKSKAK